MLQIWPILNDVFWSCILNIGVQELKINFIRWYIGHKYQYFDTLSCNIVFLISCENVWSLVKLLASYADSLCRFPSFCVEDWDFKQTQLCSSSVAKTQLQKLAAYQFSDYKVIYNLAKIGKAGPLSLKLKKSQEFSSHNRKEFTRTASQSTKVHWLGHAHKPCWDPEQLPWE